VRVLHVHGVRDTIVPVGGGSAGDFLTGKSFRTVDETASALRAGGASVEVILLQSGEHNVQTLDAAMRAERGVTLASIVGGFVRGP